MNAAETTHAQYALHCQGSDCAALKCASDWFGDVECTPASERPSAQARRDAYGDFA